MLQKSKRQIGEFSEWTYTDTKSSVSLSIVPEIGALINKLVLCTGNKCYSVIQGPEDDEIFSNPIFKSSFLVPFPNRVDGGEFKYNDNKHELPINETGNQNALHGFIYNKPFNVLLEHIDSDKFELKLKNHYEGSFPGYPYPFDTILDIEFSGEHGLVCDLKVENTGETTIPMGLGWHPYFVFGEDINALELKIPSCKIIELDDRLIPTGNEEDYTTFSEFRKLDETSYDNVFRIVENGKIAETLVRNPITGITLKVWQELGRNKYPYLVLFTPPGRKMLAIEPMSCNIDAFNNGDGLMEIQPGESAGGRFGVQLY
jgi:aldose 1-epimerase